jgi:hypothetical protein
MYFKRMAVKLFNRQRNKSRAVHSCNMRLKKKDSKKNLNVRISSTWMEYDEINPSLSTPSRLQVEHEETLLFGDIQTIEKPIKTTDLSTDSSIITTEKLWQISRENKIVEKEGPKRPALLRSEPIAIYRPPSSARLHQMNQGRIKQNLLNRSPMGSSGSKSMEYYDDRSPIFDGWSSDTSSRNSCTDLCLNNLGSIESYSDYGGDEGAKPFGSLKNSSVSQAKSYSEGRIEEENIRPQWNREDDIVPEVIHLFKGPFIDQSSSSVNQHFPRQSPSGALERSVHVQASSFQDEDVIRDSPTSHDFPYDLDDCKLLSVITLV